MSEVPMHVIGVRTSGIKHSRTCVRKVDTRLPGKLNSNPRSTKIIAMVQRNRTSRLSIKYSPSVIPALEGSSSGECASVSSLKILKSCSRCHVNMAHIRQSGSDYGRGFQVKVLKPCQFLPFRFGNGPAGRRAVVRDKKSSYIY